MEKPHLLLLPGLHGTGNLFEPLVDTLGDTVEVQTVEYPLDESLGYEPLLEIVTSSISKEKPYFVLGESFSGPLAVMAAAKTPENLLGVILVGSFVTSPVPRWLVRIKSLLRSRIVELRPRRLIIDRLLGSNCPENTRSWVHKVMPRLEKDVLLARVEAVLDVNVREELKNLKAPVMYIAGSKDWLVGRKSIDAVWLCRPDLEIKVLDGGHMILQTNPEDAAVAIKEFCDHIFSTKYKEQRAKGKSV